MESFLSSIGSFFKQVHTDEFYVSPKRSRWWFCFCFYFAIEQQPDHRPKNLAAKLAPKCRVLYFPIHPMVPANVREAPDDSTALHIVWPHRWSVFQMTSYQFLYQVYYIYDVPFESWIPFSYWFYIFAGNMIKDPRPSSVLWSHWPWTVDAASNCPYWASSSPRFSLNVSLYTINIEIWIFYIAIWNRKTGLFSYNYEFSLFF